MELVRFPQGDNEVLVDPEKVSHIRKEHEPFEKTEPAPTVCVFFGGVDEWLQFNGRDAENIWDYFVANFNKR